MSCWKPHFCTAWAGCVRCARQALTLPEEMVTNKQNFLLNLSMICDMALKWEAEQKGHLPPTVSSAHTSEYYGSDSSLLLTTRSYDSR